MLLFAPIYNTLFCLADNTNKEQNTQNSGQFKINTEQKVENINNIKIDGFIIEDSIFDPLIIEQILHNILKEGTINFNKLDTIIVFLKEKWGFEEVFIVNKEGKNYIKIIGAKKSVYRDSTGKFLFPENKTDLTGAATKLADHASKSLVNRLIINWQEVQTILTGMYMGSDKRYVLKEEPITSVQDQDKNLSCYKSLIYLYNPTSYEIMRILVSGGDKKLAQVVMHCEHNLLARFLKMLCGDSMSIYQKVNDKLESELNLKNSYSLWKKTVYLDPADLCFVHYQMQAPYAMKFSKVNIFTEFLSESQRIKLEQELFNNLNEMSTVEDLQTFFKKRKTHLKIESVETQINFKDQKEFTATLNINLEKNTAEMMKYIFLRGDPEGSKGKILKFLLTLGFYYGASKKDVEQRIVNKLNKFYKLSAYFDQDDLHVNFYGNVDRFTPADTPVSMNYKKMAFNFININFFLGVFTYIVVQPLLNFSFEVMQFRNIISKNTAKAICITGKATLNHFIRATKDLFSLCFAFELSFYGIYQICKNIFGLFQGTTTWLKLGKNLLKMCSLNWNIGLEHLLGTKYLSLNGFAKIKGRELLINDCVFPGIIEKNVLDYFKSQKFLENKNFIEGLYQKHIYKERSKLKEEDQVHYNPKTIEQFTADKDLILSETKDNIYQQTRVVNKEVIKKAYSKDGADHIEDQQKLEKNKESNSSIFYINFDIPYHFKLNTNKSCIVPNVNFIYDIQYKLFLPNAKLVFSTFDTFKLDNDTIKWSFASGFGTALIFALIRHYYKDDLFHQNIQKYSLQQLLYKCGYCNEEDFFMFTPYHAQCFIGFNIEQVQLVDGFQDMKIISMGHGTFFNFGFIFNPVYNRCYNYDNKFTALFENGVFKKDELSKYIIDLISKLYCFPALSFGYKFEIKLMVLKISLNAGWSTENIISMIEEMRKEEFIWTGHWMENILTIIFVLIMNASIRLKMIPPDRAETRGMVL